MKEVFEECQKGMHSHGKLVKRLTEIFDKTNLDDFFDEFMKYVKYSLVIYQRETAVEKTLDFCAKFIISFAEKADGGSQDVDNLDEENAEEMHPFLLKFFNFFLEHHNDKEKSIRFRCCQMFNKLLNNMSDKAQIDEDLFDKIKECMLQRIRDKFPSIRVQSVLALRRLQDPYDVDCPIIKDYLFHLSCDTNSDVRRAVLGVVAVSKNTVSDILDRTRDVKGAVRKLAYQVIAEKIHIKALTIAQRVRLLQEGLNDREESVKEACASRLLQAWLRTYEGNILELLKALDVENSVEASELALKSIFKKTQVSELVNNFDIINEVHVIKIDELSSEAVLYWRCLAEFIHSLGTENEEQLEKILPNASEYSKFVSEVLSQMKGEDNIDIQLRNDFILHQLLKISSVMDFSDEVGRRNILKVLKDMLLSSDVTYTLVKPILDVYIALMTDQDQLISQLVELISEIRMPITVVESTQSAEQKRQVDLKLASMRVKLNQYRDELEDAIQNQEFTKAAEIKTCVSELEKSKRQLLDESLPQSQEVRTEKNDADTLLKCLTIAREMLSSLQTMRLKPQLQALLENLILPGVTNAEPAVRNVAIICLGLNCLLDKETARTQLLLFMQVCQLDVETVKVSALQIIFDVLQTFGLDAFGVNSSEAQAEKEESQRNCDTFGDMSDSSMLADIASVEAEKKEEEKEKATRANSILTVVISLLDNQSSEVRTVAAEGLAKLMLSGRVVSSKLLSRLLLLWYNPVTEDDYQLRHCLGVFFPVFAFANQNNQAVVEEAFLMTLKTLFDAPATSPLAEVDVNNVADLLVGFTNARYLINKAGDNMSLDSCSHDNIAISVCNEILREPNSFNVRTLCRVLSCLEVCENNYTTLKNVKVLTSDLLKKVKDKLCIKQIEKFRRQVIHMLKNLSEKGLLTTPLPKTPHSEKSSDSFVMEQDQRDGQIVTQDRLASDQQEIDESRKRKKGKKALQSFIESPMTEMANEIEAIKTISSSRKENVSNEANTIVEEEEVFASPTPIRQFPVKQKPIGSSSKSSFVTEPVKNSKGVAADSDSSEISEEDIIPATPTRRSTRISTRVTRASSKIQSTSERCPLNEKN